MNERRTILYLGGELPKRSETFVYREVIALRERGVEVMTASVYPPERGLGDDRLNEMADDAVQIYGEGAARLICDALTEAARRPAKTLVTCGRALIDAMFGSDVRIDRRPKILWQLIAALALARRLREREARIVHIHAHMAHVPATIAMYCARQLDITFSFTGHAVDLMRQRTLLRQKLQRAAFTACISHWHRKFYEDVAAIEPDRLPVVRCGVNVDEFAPTHGVHDDRRPVRVASVGRLVDKKGFDVLIRSIEVIDKTGGDIECSIVGDGPERAALTKLISEAGMEAKIKLLGARNNEEVRALMGECDLFALPCRIDPTGDQDGIPVVLMEAMARGVCVVSGDLPTIRELITHKETGWMVEPGCVESLTEALETLCADAALRRRLGASGRRRVVDEFSQDVNIRRMIDALNGTVRGIGGEQDEECLKSAGKNAA